MSRLNELRRHIKPKMRGIEIGAYHNPIAPRSQGYRSVHLDLFDETAQRERAVADPFLSDEDVARIEPVDLVGSANDIAELVTAKFGDEKFDYVVSSHNLEHLPNPLKFLQGCQQILKPGGFVSLALPDHRYCFDFYRANTEAGEWLVAFDENRTTPTRGQLFQWVASASRIDENTTTWDDQTTSFPVPWPLLGHAYDYWTGTTKPEFLDAHCWVFTPASFRLIIEDLHVLGFHDLTIETLSPAMGCEFFVHLRNGEPGATRESVESYAERRAQTMRQVVFETASVYAQFVDLAPPPDVSSRVLVSRLVANWLRRWPRLHRFLAARLG